MESVKRPTYNHIQVEITSRCNLRCRTCLYFHFEPQWVAQDLSPKALEQIAVIAPRCRSIHLQGWGESLLREDCSALISEFKKMGPKVSLGTNGTIMDRKLAWDLIEAGLDSMAFRIAGMSAAQQDPLRGEGTFENAMRSIKLFADFRSSAKQPPILVNYLLTPANLKQLPKAMSLCSRLGVDTLQPTHMVHMASRTREN